MVGLFALAIFVAAALLFVVEPMAAKAILPLLGGSPAVWNTAMVFFQAALLAGYGAAHLLGRAGRRAQIVIYLAGLATVLGASAILHRQVVDVPRGWSPPTDANPVPWVLAFMGAMVGAPFVALAAASPLLQRWFAGSGRAGGSAARDPYFLYAASNAGSMLGLLGYVLLIEPMLALPTQRRAWTIAFVAFAVLAAACGAVFARGIGAVADQAARVDAAPPPPSRRTRLLWVALAFVPSSLTLGVTQYLSTDIAAVPLVWVIPLAIYLLTFIIAFSRPRVVSARLRERMLPVVMAALVVAFVVHGYHLPTWAMFSLHLSGLLVIGLYCHGALADLRPGPERLTEFYFLLSLGGVLGGVFNALVAPLVFPIVVEYPLVVVSACALRVLLPRADRAPGPRPRVSLVGILIAVGIGMLVPILSALGKQLDFEATPRLALVAGIPTLLVYCTKSRPALFAMAMAAVLIGAYVEPELDTNRTLLARRTFFGVYRVQRSPWYTMFTHGTTLHGLQWNDPAKRATPLSYYHPRGPIGQVFTLYGDTLGDRVGLVGMGAGSLAYYGKPGQHFTFHEIDPAVVKIAEDPRYFTYLHDCAARHDVALGDGRLTLARAPDGEYGMIVLDAFSSDSIPVHLMTREAMELYLQKLRPGGLIVFHVSNQYMALAPVVGRIAQELGLVALDRLDDVPDVEMNNTLRYGCEWVAVARREEDLAPLKKTRRWKPIEVGPRTPLWTDDYSNLVGVLRAK